MLEGLVCVKGKKKINLGKIWITNEIMNRAKQLSGEINKESRPRKTCLACCCCQPSPLPGPL